LLGNDRHLVAGVVTHQLANRFALVGGIGAFHAAGVTDTRLSLGAEATISRVLAGGIRLDDRTARGQRAALFLYGNAHLPFGTDAVRQALRLQVEHRIQPAGHATVFAVSHVF
jgi:hypothetical protein